MAINQSASTAMTITATSLAAGSARASAGVTPDTTKNITAILLTVNVSVTTTAPSGNKQVVVYGYLTEDGTNYNGGGSTGTVDQVDGTDKAVTLGSPTNLIPLGTVQLNQGTSGIAPHGVFEVTSRFGCVPRKWGFVAYNDAGTALSSITASYTEISYS